MYILEHKQTGEIVYSEEKEWDSKFDSFISYKMSKTAEKKEQFKFAYDMKSEVKQK